MRLAMHAHHPVQNADIVLIGSIKSCNLSTGSAMQCRRRCMQLSLECNLCTAGNGTNGKDTHSLAAQRVGPTEMRKMAASRPTKLPQARTYSEMAKRQRGLFAASDQVNN